MQGVHSKKPITPAMYELWNRIESPQLSADGRWAVYTLTAGQGTGDLIARSTGAEAQWRVSRGLIPTRLPLFGKRAGRDSPQITADSRYVLFSIARGDGEDLGVLRLADGQVTRRPGVKSYAVPKRSSQYVAYQVSDGTLAVREMSSGQEVHIAQVGEFAFDEQGRYLAYTVLAPEGEKRSGVYVRRLSDGQVASLVQGGGGYGSVTFDSTGERLAFLGTTAREPSASARLSLFYAASPLKAAKVAVEAATVGKGMLISPNAGVQFQGHGIAFHLTQVPREPSKAAHLPQFDLWHWKDPTIQLNQKWAGAPSYLALYDIAQGRWAQLGRASLQVVVLSENGQGAVGLDPSPYGAQGSWGERLADLYRVEVSTGAATLLRSGFRTNEWISNPYWPAPVKLSPDGRYVLYFENDRWMGQDVRSGESRDLTGMLLPGVRFDLEFRVMPKTQLPRRPLGIAGWTADSRRVLVYSLRDIWEIDPSGEASPRNLTAGLGQKENIMLRAWPENFAVNIGLEMHDVLNARMLAPMEF